MQLWIIMICVLMSVHCRIPYVRKIHAYPPFVLSFNS